MTRKVTARRRKGYAHSLTFEHHTLVSDEPPEQGGTDAGPEPSVLLAMSLAACTAITVEMYADRKGWDVGDVEVEVEYELNQDDGSSFEVAVRIPTDLSDAQLERLTAVAGKCPVHRALTGEVAIRDRILSEPSAR